MKPQQVIRTPTGVLNVIAPMAEKLRAEGVISGDLDGDLHAADAATVKAAMMSYNVCDFCSTPCASHYYDVPDFGITKDPRGGLNYSQNVAVGGWSACDACHEMIRADKRKQLVDRAVSTHAFPKFSARAVEELYQKFWNGMDDRAEAAGTAAAFGDYISERLPEQTLFPPRTDREARLATIEKLTDLTRKQVESIVRGDLDRETVSKLIAWSNRFGRGVDARRIAELASDRKPMPTIQPHWQTALDMKFAAVDGLLRAIKNSEKDGDAFRSQTAVDLRDPEAVKNAIRLAQDASKKIVSSFHADIRALMIAETYSFNGETAGAIAIAANTIPRESPLSSIETPGSGRSGWFWCAAPLNTETAAIAPDVSALLWYWAEDEDRRPELHLAAYVVARSGQYVPQPSLEWSWPIEDTLADMVAGCGGVYDEDANEMRAITKPLGRTETLSAIEALSGFFIAACLWMKQRILVGEAGHIERHARKRLTKERKLSDAPSVKVIALRRSYRESTGEPIVAPTGDGTPREYAYRWIVSGHPRLQKVGPGLSGVKLIWISPYPKGPDDKPLREQKRVYAVVR